MPFRRCSRSKRGNERFVSSIKALLTNQDRYHDIIVEHLCEPNSEGEFMKDVNTEIEKIN